MKESNQTFAMRPVSLLPRFLRRWFQGPEEGVEAMDRSESTSAPTAARAASGTAGSGAAKVLVVDDDPVILKTLGLKLSRAGYTVMTGLDGAEAISLVRTKQPDVVLLDVFFPPDVAHGATGWDGLGVLQWLRRMASDQLPPVIIITGSGNAEIHERARDLGARAVFQKPIDHKQLLDEIQQTMSEKWAARSRQVGAAAVPA
jgi:CheY-like chemotaxis protein